MLNPEAPAFHYSHLVPRYHNRSSSLGFSYTSHPASPAPISPYCYPLVQIQRPVIYSSIMTYFPRLPQPPQFLTQSFDGMESNENRSAKGLELSVDLPAKMEEMPMEMIEAKVETKVAVRYRRFPRGSSSPSPCVGKKRLIWRPKVQMNTSELKGTSASECHISSLDFIVSEAEHDQRTTLMIKNIPNRFRNMLLELLDKHSAQENEKARLDSEPILSEYDFMYLPIDFKNRCNLGYAFVNFTTVVAATRLYKSMHKYKWEIFDSKKTCEICYARIQGRDALVGHFQNSFFRCDSEEFLPILLSPPRDGSTSRRQDPVVLGRRRVYEWNDGSAPLDIPLLAHEREG